MLYRRSLFNRPRVNTLPGCFQVFLDDRESEADRVVGTYRTEAEARAEARRRNAELLAGGADPWRAPLYYVFTGRDEGDDI